jgi:nucleotide-binding universal stress UspA family protein
MDGPRIVVGVDGSEGSRAALAWALREGTTRGAIVEAVMCWTAGGLPRVGHRGGLGSGRDATVLLDRLLNEAQKPPGGVCAAIKPIVIEGHPVRVLPESSIGADLLVVGSRGYGAFVGSVLGSVSLAVASRATCPVAVIPDPAQSQHRSLKLATSRRNADDITPSEASRWRAVRGSFGGRNPFPSTRDSA